MRKLSLVPVVFCLSVSACVGDETVAGYGAADRVWAVTELDGVPFDSSATLIFPERGRISGRAPCNNYTAAMDAPYPWFAAGPIAATRMLCPDDAAEQAYFEALSAMTLSEILGDTMILSNDAGRSIVFTARD